jgi:hypothetical protein
MLLTLYAIVANIIRSTQKKRPVIVAHVPLVSIGNTCGASARRFVTMVDTSWWYTPDGNRRSRRGEPSRVAAPTRLRHNVLKVVGANT